MNDEPPILEHAAWSGELAQMVTNAVGPHDGPILVYAEDYLGGVMNTAVMFRRGERLLALNFLEPGEQEVLSKVQNLYQHWGGRHGDIRALKLIIAGDNVSPRLLSVDDVGESDGLSFGFRSRLSALTIEVFGRDWRKGDGDMPEILRHVGDSREVRRERMLQQLRRMLGGSDP